MTCLKPSSSPSKLPLLFFFDIFIFILMEVCNSFAADVVVISCCCPCLILQILVFVLLKLPYKLVMKSKRVIVKVKLSCKSRKRRDETRWRLEDQQRSDGQNIAGHGRDTARIIVEQKWVHDLSRYHECRSLVLMEVEKMLEELYLKGEFAFGSFWGRDQTGNFSHDHDIAQQEFDDVLQNQLIGIIKSLRNQ